MNSEKKEEILIISGGKSKEQYWQDLWRYRELFYVLAWRDVSVRYKETILGVVWTLIKPILTMAILTFVFSKIAKLPTQGATPYALMVYAGLLPWMFFSSALSESANSLIGNANLISKIYFPRLIVPIATMIVSLVDFLVGFLILIGLMLYYEFSPGWQILALPFFVLMLILACLGPSLWIAAMNVKFRDFRYVIPFLIQFGLYISPVGFSTLLIPDKWQVLYSINPMVGVIDGFRWALLGGEYSFNMNSFFVGWLVILIMLYFGLKKFRSMENEFSDLL